MKAKENKTNAMRVLDRAKIPYETYSYEHEDGKIDGVSVAQKLGQPVEQVFKTLVTRGTDRNFYVFVIPVAKELNLKAAARAVGQKSVEMIHVDEIKNATGYIRGGCSPIGMKKQYKTVIDESAQKLSFIIVSGGKIGQQIQISPLMLCDLISLSISRLNLSVIFIRSWYVRFKHIPCVWQADIITTPGVAN